jgi:putative ATP-dependent endonuclease of OLD family
MKIRRIIIDNYKSISHVDIFCNRHINSFIGENSVGKSNIFDAINWALGPVFPSFNSTLPQDHYMGDPNNLIRIKLCYDNDEYLELAENWTDPNGYTKSGLNLSGRYINDIQRQTYCSAYLGVERNILDHLPSNRWSLMGRILQDINELFKKEEIVDETSGEVIKKSDLFKSELEKIRDNVLFTVQDNQGNLVMKMFIELLQKETAIQLNRPQEDLSIDLNLYDPWNFFRTLQVIVKDSCTNMHFQASRLGMGVQASISIAVLKAYSQLKLNNNTPLFIDEPELYLHPQAQRNFYKVLCELATSGTQIFYTTHSPNFLSVGRFDEIHVTRKDETKGTFVNSAHPQRFVVDLNIRTNIQTDIPNLCLQYKNAYEETGDTQKANEAFFAKRIILVEGQSESLVLPYLFDLVGFDYIAFGITIVRCGSKGEIDRFYRLYVELGIPCYVIFDGDSSHIGTEHEANTIQKNHAILSLFGNTGDFPDNNSTNDFLGFANTLNENLGFDTSSKGLKLFKQVRQKLTTAESVPQWVTDVRLKVEALTEFKESVLKRPT